MEITEFFTIVIIDWAGKKSYIWWLELLSGKGVIEKSVCIFWIIGLLIITNICEITRSIFAIITWSTASTPAWINRRKIKPLFFSTCSDKFAAYSNAPTTSIILYFRCFNWSLWWHVQPSLFKRLARTWEWVDGNLLLDHIFKHIFSSNLVVGVWVNNSLNILTVVRLSDSPTTSSSYFVRANEQLINSIALLT